MVKYKKAVLITGLGLVIVILFFIFGTPKYQSLKVKYEKFEGLESKLKAEVNTNTEIDIKKLTDFEWDECYVFNPYYPSKQVYEKVGTEWTSFRTFIGFFIFHDIENETVNDNQYLIVFKKDSKVILSKVYSIIQLPIIFKMDNYKFTSNNAKFIVTVAKQYDDGNVKELVLRK
jgi:hypothetical protein